MRSDRDLTTILHCLQWYKLVQRILAYPMRHCSILYVLAARGVATGVYRYIYPPNQSTLNVLCGCFVSLTHLYSPKSNSWLRPCLPQMPIDAETGSFRTARKIHCRNRRLVGCCPHKITHIAPARGVGAATVAEGRWRNSVVLMDSSRAAVIVASPATAAGRLLVHGARMHSSAVDNSSRPPTRPLGHPHCCLCLIANIPTRPVATHGAIHTEI